MDDQLISLLEYRGVLTALATTPDGLVIAAAGLGSDDAEVVGAAGATLFSSENNGDSTHGVIELDQGSMHVLRSEELSLVLLTEPDVPHEALVELMEESLSAVSGAFF
jgi:predicted regulator of Ras-like GTPase activity (Roadblock/LC7/MglB family)